MLSFIAVKTGLAQLPASDTWRGVIGVGMLDGIGLTMSLFIADLSFGAELYNQARLGIIVASLMSAGLGIALLATLLRGLQQRIRYSGVDKPSCLASA